MFADVADKVKEPEFPEPIVIVDDQCGIGRATEIKKFLQLFLLTLLVMAQRFFREQVSFGRLAGRIAYHARCTAHKYCGSMAAMLEVQQGHDLHQVADSEGISRGVESDVSGCHALIQHGLGARHDVVQHTPPLEFFHKILHILYIGSVTGMAVRCDWHAGQQRYSLRQRTSTSSSSRIPREPLTSTVCPASDSASR